MAPVAETTKAFEAAARLLSFRKAADELSVTPTAISHQIKLLEQYCGQDLFIRRPRPLSLTQMGAGLLPVVNAALVAIAEEIAAIRGEPGTIELKITATNAFAARWPCRGSRTGAGAIHACCSMSWKRTAS